MPDATRDDQGGDSRTARHTSVKDKVFSAAARVARRERTRRTAEEHIREIALRPKSYGPPRRMRDDVSVSVAHREGWAVYTVEPASADPSATLVYLHGGAWIHEITKPHWRFVEELAAEACVRVVVPIYPLIPFGTAASVVPMVADLAAESAGDRLYLMGDSSGGQIALSVALELRDSGRANPVGTVLISPALEIELRNPAIASVSDPWIDPPSLREYGRWWRGDLAEDDPRASPLHADFTGLGPLTVFSGTRDVLNPDARVLVEKARSSGVTVDYHEGADLTHVYPLFPTSEGRRALRLIVAALRDNDSQPALDDGCGYSGARSWKARMSALRMRPS